MSSKVNIIQILIVLTAFVLTVSAMCPGPDSFQDHPFKFVPLGATCDGVNPLLPLDPSASITDPERGCSMCCKNFQSCLPANASALLQEQYTCIEISQNMTCDISLVAAGIQPCGVSMDCLAVDAANNDYRCFYPYHLENGAACTISEQCQSENCQLNATGAFFRSTRAANTTTGAPTMTCMPKANPGFCTSQSDCPAHQWCNFINGTCLDPIASGDSCAAIADHYEDIMNITNYVCAPGTACVKNPNAKNGVTFTCVPYYSQSKSNPSCYADAWWNCQFGFFCNTSDTGANALGTCIVTNQAGAIGDKCKSFPLTSAGQSECYWGTGCSCFTSNNTGSGQCQHMYNTNCEIQLRNLVSCIKNKKCPHDGTQLLGGNPTPFASSTVVGSCVQTYCSQAHANLLKCQNDINAPKSSVSPAYIPRTFPNNDYTNGSSGLQGWEIGLIIVGIAVAIIIIVVIVVAIVRRRSNTGYQPLE